VYIPKGKAVRARLVHW